MSLGALGAVAAVVSAAANVFSSHKTNKTNKSIADANNATMIELANTSHQREVKDLQEAGLNPILSANSNGAAVPQLANTQLQAPQINMDSIMNAVATIGQYEKNQAEKDLTNATTAKTKLETQLAPRIAEAQIALQNAQGNLTKQKEIREKLEADIASLQKEYYKQTGTVPNMAHTARELKGIFSTGKSAGQGIYNATSYLNKDFKHLYKDIEKDVSNLFKEKWDYKTQSFKKY